jgi:phytoene synthase
VTTTALVIRRDDRLACRDWIRIHSKSFYLSSLLLPSRVREASWALYAFCRRADDAVDNDNDNAVALKRIERLRSRLDDVYKGRIGDDAIDRAFAIVVEKHGIPRVLPEALLLGMEMDARAQRYDDERTLLVYCFRVAATVGLMMTRVMGASDDSAYVRAADLGIAMRLTNIARDVGEDARRGRVYLPADLCARAGFDAKTLLSAERATEPLKQVIRQILDKARLHYESADVGIPLLPRDCRLAIASSRHIYAGIGDAIAANDYDSVTRRAYVSTAGKLWRVARALPAVFARPRRDARGDRGPKSSSASGAEEVPSRGEATVDEALRELVRAVGLPA